LIEEEYNNAKGLSLLEKKRKNTLKQNIIEDGLQTEYCNE